MGYNKINAIPLKYHTMPKFIIEGGYPLKGEIRVGGAKNMALKLFPAALLTDKEWVISNVPALEDIRHSVGLFQSVGGEVGNVSAGTYSLRAKDIRPENMDPNICLKIQTSILMCAPLLARYGKVFFSKPGGCAIGPRPHDIFWAGFKTLGAKIKKNKHGYLLTAKGLRGSKFVFPWISVGATEAMILAAVLAKGKTILKNAACEPEISALADFLNECGAKIRGVGSPTVEITGVNSLSGGKCKVIPDRIEAGSFIAMGLAAKSPIKITNMNPDHLDALWSSLSKCGVNLDIGRDFVQIKPDSWKKMKGVEIRTHEYPGFPTDLQPPFTVLMTQAKGLSLIHETIYERRLFFTDMLNNQMGAKIIICDPHRAIVQGPTKLFGAKVISPDIRAGLAMVIAGLIAKGKTEVENIYQIDRGYENLEERLRRMGAKITRAA